MVFKGYAFQLILRISLMAISMAVFIYLLMLNEYMITAINVGFLVLFQIYMIYRYHSKFQQDLNYFFDSIQNRDYNVHFTSGIGFGALRERLNYVINSFHDLTNKYEKQYQLYKYSLDQVQVGIMIARNNSLKYINSKCLEIFSIDGRPGDKHRFEDILKNQISFLNFIENTTGGQSGMVKIKSAEDELIHSVKRANFSVDEIEHEIFIIVPIQNDLDLHEVEIWQRLISVLTHEIMNSLSPVTSLSEKLQLFFNDYKGLNAKELSQTIKGLNLIHRKGEQIMKFVDRYRSVSSQPLPQKSIVKLSEILYKSIPEEAQNVIYLNKNTENIYVYADTTQLTQVIQNLLLNAWYALETTPEKHIEIQAYQKNNHILIEISDNGKGIPKELINKIFTPFFTTRKNGHGVGLSYVRQIMYMHNGSVKVKSEEGKGSTFTLSIPNKP